MASSTTTVVVEFDLDQRTYQVEAILEPAEVAETEVHEASQITTERDLISGGDVVVDWSRVTAVRTVPTSNTGRHHPVATAA